MFDGFNITIEWIKGIFDYIVEFFGIIFSLITSLFSGLKMTFDGISFVYDLSHFLPTILVTCILSYLGVRVVRWILPFD